ncbi:site-specific integrase, partial [Pseudomonas syringae group genomosp. 7]|uniref:site-specific integrase n=1 Tax=Pseudomonas syringae group genomosp. 7 TaxID=251699 RepID=UPI0037706619
MAKQKFKITNWSTYNKALINRGGDPLESTCRHASFRVEMCIRDRRRLTAAEFQHLAAMPAAVEWFANIDNPRTRRAYQNDLQDFCSFVGLAGAEEFRAVTRSHVLAWRAQLELRGLAGATIRRKLAALASLFDHLLENNAVAGGNPVHGVKRPRVESNEGK